MAKGSEVFSCPYHTLSPTFVTFSEGFIQEQKNVLEHIVPRTMFLNMANYDVFDTFLAVAAIESKRGVTLDLGFLCRLSQKSGLKLFPFKPTKQLFLNFSSLPKELLFAVGETAIDQLVFQVIQNT